MTGTENRNAAGISGGDQGAPVERTRLGILPAAGLTLLLGVERFMSEIRAVTNLFGNIFATLVVSKWMGELKDEQLSLVLDGEAGGLGINEGDLPSQARA